MFLVAAEAFAQLFERHVNLTGLGVIRLCADDVGGALNTVEALPVLKIIFDVAAKVANLRLNVSKCVLVLLGRAHSMQA
eukprot:1996784-Karenia_brevis.AAC.1